jgi:hypothetical protein
MTLHTRADVFKHLQALQGYSHALNRKKIGFSVPKKGASVLIAPQPMYP